jgi:nitric oxide reductase
LRWCTLLTKAVQVIAKVLGVPDEDSDYLIKCTAVRSNGSATAREAAEASKDLLDYLSKLVSRKEQDPADDLISKLVIEQVTLPYKIQLDLNCSITG